tara:strand:+ start:428 stop:1225 length:798 start_codon:yes stop_codon:yes gene_type:complete
MIEKILFTLATTLMAGALFQSPASAQGNGDAAFCASAPSEMLKAIDGKWKFTQGAGYGIGGVVPFPLPAHRPQSVSIRVDDNVGVAFLEHEGQKLAILPLPGDDPDINEIAMTMTEKEKILNKGGACEWYALPVMMGFNMYALAEGVGGDDNASMTTIGLGGQSIFFCKDGSNFGIRNRPTEGGIKTHEYDPETDGNDPYDPDKRYVADNCDRPQPMPDLALDGAMIMTLLVRFDSPNSGQGVLQFEGKYGPTNFAARAPVTFTK